jgi:hypothetical protein
MTTTAPVLCRTALNYASKGAPSGLDPGPVEVEIRDGRVAAATGELGEGWRDAGFELVDHRSTVADWTDDVEIAEVHYPEVEALARALTGASHALVADHVKRTAEQAKREREQAPVRLVHSDFAAGYDEIVRTSYREVHGRGARTLARSGLTSDDIETAPRLVMMQFWRNLGAPKMDLPVAFCDGRSVGPDESRPFHYTGYVAGGRSFDALGIVAPTDASAHRWYAYPEMTSDEVVAFRTYDTELVAAGRTWFTPHAAYRDPDVELGQPARFSIELRVMCLFR